MQERKIHIAQAIIIAAIVVIVLLVCLLGSGSASGADGAKYSKATDLDGQPLAVVTGSEYTDYADLLFPNSEKIHFNDWPSEVVCVVQGKAEGLLTDLADARLTMVEYPELTFLPDPLAKMEFSFLTQHNERGVALAEEFNDFIATVKESGEYDAIQEKWLNDIDGAELEPCTSDGSRGELYVACGNDWTPNCYVRNGENVGAYFDLIYRFCESAGYTPVIDVVGFDSGFAGVASKKYDMLAYGYMYSEERAESVTFTDAMGSDDIVMMVRKSSVADAGYTDMSQLEGKVFAESAGSIGETLITENVPNAQFLYVSGFSEIFMSVQLGKADACIVGGVDIDELLKTYPGLKAIDAGFSYPPSAFATAKNDRGDKVLAEFNEYFTAFKASGEFDALNDSWSEAKEDNYPKTEFSFSGEKGELNIGIVVNIFPSTFVDEDGYAGFEIDVIEGFCQWAGYTPKYEDASFPALAAGLATGKYDILAVNLCITEERAEQMNFAVDLEPTVPLVALVRDNSAPADASTDFFAELASSFEKNFIREGRWKMMLSGLGVTLALSLCTALLGTLLGALICGLHRSKNCFATGFARIYIKFFQGMPIVVLLLILYYVIFGKADISAFFVCVLGFSFDFSAYVSEIFRNGIDAVSAGQQRAALALGFSKPASFRSVVLPQAMRHILPVYRGQFIAMVKTTAIAGYISVQDLTKVSDIIRSRTYEAFFPLISTAVIYFLLAALLVSTLRLIELRTDPLRRSREPKGVKL